MKNIIEIKDVSKQFKHQVVLDNLSLTIEEGGVYGLLGPNGAGKSTLLKMITQVIKPDSGIIYFKSKPIKQSDLLQIGAIIENPAIYPNLTAYENLEVLVTLLNISKTRIKEVLSIVSLDNTGKKLAKDFSFGMKQRLGIAMALINHPKLLILDEPTNGLDPVGIQELRELIKLFSSQGITVILSSHLLSEVQQVADKVGIINHGRLRYEGKNDPTDTHLEELFMEIIKQDGRENDEVY
ncbi:lantibiotic protection ABC transporter ATP-binding subunit [Vagococcus bubulae]|uniref:Lantibiotic ABC transporter ATP-binding protein n=1 Tax=Vagococcus bubulae TaxID=1977868 RepID=A0A429ZR20_9ENTE|nr:lantibiotic protection ABC transporter ATP-binding subunit [Vagococcus bubulae]RST96174.1 lantibiotic ABC transporter ATP-binding protein [Vagococcus bubulae]